MSNRKIQYTKRTICDALVSLLKEKPLEKISVTEVCRRADVNRSSFYKHYLDIYDLMDKLEDEEYEKIYQATLKDIQLSPDMKDTPSRLRQQALTAIRNNPEFYRLILADPNNRFLTRLTKDTYTFLSDEYVPLADREALFPMDLRPFEKECAIQYLLHGSISVMQLWLENGCKETVDEIDQVLSKLNRSVVRIFWLPSESL